MIDETNPAGRLYKVLVAIKATHDHTKAINAWAQVIGCEAKEVEVTRAVVDLYLLSEEVQTLISMIPEINAELYLASFIQLSKAFFPLNLHNNIQHTKAKLTEESLTRLQFCADALGKSYAEDSIDEESLNQIIELTNMLYEQIRLSTMPDKLKLALLEELEKIKRSIVVYSIKGAKGLKESLQSLLGMVVTNQEELKKIEDKGILQNVGELIEKIDSISSVALKVKSISQKIGLLLPFSGV